MLLGAKVKDKKPLAIFSRRRRCCPLVRVIAGPMWRRGRIPVAPRGGSSCQSQSAAGRLSRVYGYH